MTTSLAQRFADSKPQGISNVSRDANGALVAWVENGCALSVARGAGFVVLTLQIGNARAQQTFYFDASGQLSKVDGEYIPSEFSGEIVTRGVSGVAAGSSFAGVFTWASRPLSGLSVGATARFSDIGSGSALWSWNGSDWTLQSATPAYTFATLPLPTAYTGTAFVIDIGEHGSLWYSNGITWGVVGGSVDLYSSAVAQPAHTGVLTTTVQKSFTLPGGLLGLNGAYRLFARWSCTNNANLKIAYSRIGATPFTGVGFTTVASTGTMAEVQNRNSLTSQIGSNGSPSMSSNWANAFSTHAINTAADHTVDFAAQLANVGDSMTLESYRVTLIRP